MLSARQESPVPKPKSRRPDHVPLWRGQSVLSEASQEVDLFTCYGFADFERILVRVDQLRAECHGASRAASGASISSFEVKDDLAHLLEHPYAEGREENTFPGPEPDGREGR